jgi:hypothetical protein
MATSEPGGQCGPGERMNMHSVDELVEKIVSYSQIPSGRRRLEIARELRAHIEDFALIAREAGHSEEEIHRLVLANFGEPREIAQEFARVYRRERAILRVSAFLLSTLVAASFISAAVLALQASMAIGLGVPILRVFGSSHLTLETFYLLSTAAAYVGLISLEKLFHSARLGKAIALLALILTIAGAGLAVANAHPGILIAGSLSGVLLRLIQAALANGVVRVVALMVCFALFGFVSASSQSLVWRPEIVLRLLVWAAIGICCHLMTHLAARMDRALLNGV